jgi:hypothetical protein
MAVTKETQVTEEMKEIAEAQAAKRNEKPAEKAGDGRRLRTKGEGSQKSTFVESDVPYPTEVHGEDFEFYGPQGYAAEIPDDVEISDYSVDQEFVLNEDKVRNLMFDRPGRDLPKKRLYVIKALHKDGRLVQLPFELQIQNNAGGDPEDAIGLRRYQRKGIHLLLDLNTMAPVYCAAWDCWAEAQNNTDHAGFCSVRHAQHTLPNHYKNAKGIMGGLMEQGVTTSSTWSA